MDPRAKIPIPKVGSVQVTRYLFTSIAFFFSFFFLGAHLQHMEVPGLGAESELQLWAYATATAMPDLSHICGNARSLIH